VNDYAQWVKRAEAAEAEVKELTAELDRITGWAAKYFEALCQARECCARPRGICFDPALIDGEAR